MKKSDVVCWFWGKLRAIVGKTNWRSVYWPDQQSCTIFRDRNFRDSLTYLWKFWLKTTVCLLVMWTNMTRYPPVIAWAGPRTKKFFFYLHILWLLMLPSSTGFLGKQWPWETKGAADKRPYSLVLWSEHNSQWVYLWKTFCCSHIFEQTWNEAHYALAFQRKYKVL